jgi:hypothetical protein
MSAVELPAGAIPCRPHITVNPADKAKRRVGLNPKESSAFSGICRVGAEQFLDCYRDSNFPFSPNYLAESCEMCPYCANIFKRHSSDYFFSSHFYPDYINSMSEVDCETPSSYVYLVTDGNYVKIGVADDVRKRLGGIQTGNPNKCYVICVIPCKDSKSAFSVEKKLHHEYSLRRKCGEWFDLLCYIDLKSFQAHFPAEDYVSEEDIYQINY